MLGTKRTSILSTTTKTLVYYVDKEVTKRTSILSTTTKTLVYYVDKEVTVRVLYVPA